MARGGHANSGPAPDPAALRRDRPSDQASWTHLAPDVVVEVPAWPLSRAKPREMVLWASEWSRPQAVMWKARDQVLEVALYVRCVVVAENAKATAADRTLVLRYMEDLGISASGLARNRWVIDDAGAAAQPREDRPAAAAGSSVRERLKLVG